VASRPIDPLTVVAAAVAVVAISSAAPLIAYAAAPALAIAFWRNALATGVLAPAAATGRRRADLRALLGRREGAISGLAGAALALHFGAWVPSAKLTTVAAATALVATQPVWQGLIARAQGRSLPWPVWAGIAVAVAGAGLTTGADLAVSARAVAGDLLALVGGLAGAAYTALGERVRRTTSTTAYTTVCYGVCAALLGAVCLVAGVPLGGFSPSTWLAIAALVAGAQLLGHSMFNYALRRVPATTVSVLMLLEVPGAAVIGWLWLRQVPAPAAWPGLALVVAGVATILVAHPRPGRALGDPRMSPR